MLPDETPPLLAGLRIVAVEQYGAGPIGTLHLASLGAEVIKIENPREGDVSRSVGPHFVPGIPRDRASLFYQGLNHDKQSLTLDLSRPEGREVLQRLVATADALVSNLRGDVPERLGLTHAQLARYNPTLVCAHLSAYGREGSRKAWPGYDYLMQAEAGYFALTGEPDGPPTRFGLSIVDFMTGLALAYGVAAGVLSARTTGRGRDVDVNLFDVALFNLNYVATWYLNAGAAPERAPRSAHLSMTPCQLCRTADGFIYVMCNKEKFWQVLVDELGRPEWKTDPRFEDYAARLEHRDTLTLLLDEAFSAATTARWLERLSGKVPAAPVLDVPAALSSPFVTEEGRLVDVPLGDGRHVRLVRAPVRSAGDSREPTPAPGLGEHTDAILSSLGYDPASIMEMRRKGVV